MRNMTLGSNLLQATQLTMGAAAETPCSSLLTDLWAPSYSTYPRETLSLHWLMCISSHYPMDQPHSYPGQCPTCVSQPPNPVPRPHHWEGPMQGVLCLSLSVLPVPWDGTGNCSHRGTQFPAHSSPTLAIASCCPWLHPPHPPQWGMTILVSSLQRYHSLTKSPSLSLGTEGSFHHAQEEPCLIPPQPHLS